ncbi:MAG: hypothetical protein HYT79_00285 [Elusimicrobia bacterium]|nr:hypothetical protein [Elusimicrobiota bacterium]
MKKQPPKFFLYDIQDEDLKAGLCATPEQVLIWLTRANRLVWTTGTKKIRRQTKKYLH